MTCPCVHNQMSQPIQWRARMYTIRCSINSPPSLQVGCFFSNSVCFITEYWREQLHKFDKPPSPQKNPTISFVVRQNVFLCVKGVDSHITCSWSRENSDTFSLTDLVLWTVKIFRFSLLDFRAKWTWRRGFHFWRGTLLHQWRQIRYWHYFSDLGINRCSFCCCFSPHSWCEIDTIFLLVDLNGVIVSNSEGILFYLTMKPIKEHKASTCIFFCVPFHRWLFLLQCVALVMVLINVYHTDVRDRMTAEATTKGKRSIVKGTNFYFARNNKKSVLCYILTFDPAQNAIQGHAPEGSDTF